MTSVDLAVLPDISFAPLSTKEVESAVITAYERLTGVTLQPADPVRLFLESLAYVIGIQNGLIDLAGKQNLLAYARGAHLEHIGAPMGVGRIPAQPARVMLRFSVPEVLDFAVPIPAGTRAATRNGAIIFATAVATEIPAGELSIDVVAFCTVPGAAATGLVPGQIAELLDRLPWVFGVSNVSVSSDGADVEDDDRLRERIRLAPESYATAGPEGAYRALVLAVSQEIAEVAVDTPSPGVVDIRFVLRHGELPDQTMVDLVLQSLSDEKVRPLTDHVLVGAPDVVEYAVAGRWYLRRADAALLGGVTMAVEQATERYRLWQRGKPGRDINPTRLISLLEQAGAKRVELDSPAFAPLSATQIARETSLELAFGGLEDE